MRVTVSVVWREGVVSHVTASGIHFWNFGLLNFWTFVLLDCLTLGLWDFGDFGDFGDFLTFGLWDFRTFRLLDFPIF